MATLQVFRTDSVISIDTLWEVYLDCRKLSFFGWAPKATAKVSADSKAGTLITEFTANLK